MRERKKCIQRTVVGIRNLQKVPLLNWKLESTPRHMPRRIKFHKLFARWATLVVLYKLKPNYITLAGSKFVGDQLRTSYVMEFGF